MCQPETEEEIYQREKERKAKIHRSGQQGYCRKLIGDLGHDFIWDTFSERKRK